MLSFTVQRVGAEVRIRLVRFTPGSPYPQRLFHQRYDQRPGDRGRDELRHAIALLSVWLDETDPQRDQPVEDVRSL